MGRATSNHRRRKIAKQATPSSFYHHDFEPVTSLQFTLVSTLLALDHHVRGQSRLTHFNHSQKERLMKNRFQVINRLALAGALASGFLSIGVAASAQTTAPAPASPSATTVSMSTVNTNADRRMALEQDSADARRVEFRKLGTSL
ncbi:MAG: hypothetical protein ABSB70_18285 [Candidatus Velthaea sp.]